MAPLPAPAEKPSHRVSDSQSHAKVRPPTQVAVFCAALWPNLQPALTARSVKRAVPLVLSAGMVSLNAAGSAWKSDTAAVPPRTSTVSSVTVGRAGPSSVAVNAMVRLAASCRVSEETERNK